MVFKNILQLTYHITQTFHKYKFQKYTTNTNKNFLLV